MIGGTCFVFDLDGTITTQELLPVIASALNLEREMRLLTQITLNGTIPFEDSFRLRCAALGAAPLSLVRELVGKVELEPHILEFLQKNRTRCYIATGNLDCWIEPIVARLGCQCFTSRSVVEGDVLKGVATVLRKSTPARQLTAIYERVVVIGESVNDLPMFEIAHIGVAFGGVHPPVPSVVEAAAYVSYDGASLCRLLDTL